MRWSRTGRRAPRTPAGILLSAAPGYAVRLPVEAVDAWRFESVLRRARTEPPERARESLEEALGWWRGSAYAEFADEEWTGAEIARLGELRLLAREALAAATLACGRAEEAVLQADALTRDQPLREEGWRLLALALWASGRQADALDALRRNRKTLRDELGLDPGQRLADLENAVLAGRTEALRAMSPRPMCPSVRRLPRAHRPGRRPRGLRRP